MATIEQRVNEFATQVGTDINGILASIGTLTGLTTTDKTNLVNAINEVAADAASGLNQAEVDARVALQVQVLTDAAPAALDTFLEFANALGNDPNFAASITASLANKVDFSVAQTKTVAEKLTACTNLGIGNPDANYLVVYTTARDA